MDWNWFFSSLAQSAASITGILGAFIVSKIISNQTNLSEKKNRLKELLYVAEKIKADVDETLSPNIELIRNNKPLNEWENVETKKTIQSLKREAHHQIRIIPSFVDSIEDLFKHGPSLSLHLSFALIFVFLLFYIGVFLPLNYLPTPKDWVPSVISSQQQMIGYLVSPFLFDTPFFGDNVPFSSIPPAINNVKHVILMAFIYIFFTITLLFLDMNYSMRKIFERDNYDDLEKLKLFMSIENYASEDYVDYFVNKC